jgi:hypothetical protein
MILLDNDSLTECMNDVADIVQILGKIERMADGTRKEMSVWQKK